jgi:hypothetical protein
MYLMMIRIIIYAVNQSKFDEIKKKQNEIDKNECRE